MRALRPVAPGKGSGCGVRTACLFRGGSETVLDRAAIVEDLGEEARRGQGIHLQARLPEYVLCHGQRMPVQVQVTDVLKQETDERIALASSLAVTCAGLADGALHDVATRKSTAGQ